MGFFWPCLVFCNAASEGKSWNAWNVQRVRAAVNLNMLGNVRTDHFGGWGCTIATRHNETAQEFPQNFSDVTIWGLIIFQNCPTGGGLSPDLIAFLRSQFSYSGYIHHHTPATTDYIDLLAKMWVFSHACLFHSFRNFNTFYAIWISLFF